MWNPIPSSRPMSVCLGAVQGLGAEILQAWVQPRVFETVFISLEVRGGSESQHLYSTWPLSSSCKSSPRDMSWSLLMLSPRQSRAASLHLSHTSTPGAISISEPQQHNSLAQHTAALTMPSHSARDLSSLQSAVMG